MVAGHFGGDIAGVLHKDTDGLGFQSAERL